MFGISSVRGGAIKVPFLGLNLRLVDGLAPHFRLLLSFRHSAILNAFAEYQRQDLWHDFMDTISFFFNILHSFFSTLIGGRKYFGIREGRATVALRTVSPDNRPYCQGPPLELVILRNCYFQLDPFANVTMT